VAVVAQTTERREAARAVRGPQGAGQEAAARVVAAVAAAAAVGSSAVAGASYSSAVDASSEVADVGAVCTGAFVGYRQTEEVAVQEERSRVSPSSF
jgi:hypothetical protein